MSEDALRAARNMAAAAEAMNQAGRNIEGTLERFQMLWERQIQPDLNALMDRLEAINKPKELQHGTDCGCHYCT